MLLFSFYSPFLITIHLPIFEFLTIVSYCPMRCIILKTFCSVKPLVASYLILAVQAKTASTPWSPYDDVALQEQKDMYLAVLTRHNLHVEHTGALADCIAGGTLVESWGTGADVS